ncbi:carbonic anhydrase [Solemya velum gill symbiont]|uniref:carbonic anhydrase n=2 Tax=Solemya velum gill symbiont TaxID=2340 RepID=A0A0B0H749_SOVGS|nr:carbonic anhydrase [Solemya velum gill symbiont]
MYASIQDSYGERLMISAQQALQRLQEGNRRFVSGTGHGEELFDTNRRDQLVSGQEPFAIILGCSDSRVPAEIVFDQGLGDLFVIRVAGNIVAPSQVGSVEFAAEQFKTPLVVVMGHTHCGAIRATIDELHRPVGERSKNIQAIVDRIRPSIESLVSTPLWEDQEEFVKHATRANVRASVNQLRHGSALLEKLTEEQGLVITGAEYDIQSGEIDFFEC